MQILREKLDFHFRHRLSQEAGHPNPHLVSIRRGGKAVEEFEEEQVKKAKFTDFPTSYGVKEYGDDIYIVPINDSAFGETPISIVRIYKPGHKRAYRKIILTNNEILVIPSTVLLRFSAIAGTTIFTFGNKVIPTT